MIGQMKSLLNLDLSGSIFKDDWLRYIVRLPLTRLRLSTTDVGEEGIRYVCRIKSLEKLDFEGVKLSDDSLQLLTTLPRLSELNLRGAAFTHEGLRAIKGLPRLSYLNVAYTHVDDSDCQTLDAAPALISISLENTDVTGTGLAKLRKVYILRLQHCKLNDADIITGVTKLPNLHTLDLSFTDVTGHSLAALAKAKQLRHVILDQCPKITDADLVQFRRLRPDCKVNYKKPTSDL